MKHISDAATFASNDARAESERIEKLAHESVPGIPQGTPALVTGLDDTGKPVQYVNPAIEALLQAGESKWWGKK